MIRVHRIPYSTNVERVALGCGIKGLEVEWVDHDPADRRAIRRLSGQELVPVAEIRGKVVADSVAILEHLDRESPEHPLYPAAAADRAFAEIFIEWFNAVWKGPPNALDADPLPPSAVRRKLAAELDRWTALFERRLSGGGFLLGPEPGIADVVAYPFLRYAVDVAAPDDVEPFHAILHRHLSPGEHPALDAWIGRMAALPQA